MHLDIVVAFFLLGFVARLARAEIHFPPALYQSLSLFLMLAIGLKGGIALENTAAPSLFSQSIAVVVFGLLLPLLAFPMLFWIGNFSREDSASVAAHYGSVSVGTYAVAVALLEARGISYEAYFPLFVVLLEVPAIVVGLALARHGGFASFGEFAHKIFFNQGMVLLMGGLMIGYSFGPATEKISPLFFDLFYGALALFLLEMGISAASRLSEFQSKMSFLLAFGVFMPLLGAASGAMLGSMLDLSTGGVALLAVLGGSASYIAVPATMRVALPDANHGLSMTASLGITFPFNVIVGIPVYIVMAQWLTSA